MVPPSRRGLASAVTVGSVWRVAAVPYETGDRAARLVVTLV